MQPGHPPGLFTTCLPLAPGGVGVSFLPHSQLYNLDPQRQLPVSSLLLQKASPPLSSPEARTSNGSLIKSSVSSTSKARSGGRVSNLQSKEENHNNNSAAPDAAAPAIASGGSEASETNPNSNTNPNPDPDPNPNSNPNPNPDPIPN